MPGWIDNSQAFYVTAAYSVAASGLLGLLFVSWRKFRKLKAVWLHLRGKSETRL